MEEGVERGVAVIIAGDLNAGIGEEPGSAECEREGRRRSKTFAR